MKQMKKGLAIFLCTVLMGSLVTGCGQTTEETPTAATEEKLETKKVETSSDTADTTDTASVQKTIGCVIINDANPHCLAFADTFKAIVEEKGDKAIVLPANDDPELLMQCMNDLIAQGVDGIVLESPNATAPVQAIKEAVEKGIVVAAADVLIDITEEEGLLVSQTVSDNYGAGALCGEDFVKRVEGKEATVCHIVYDENQAVTERVQGFLNVIAKHDNVKVLEGQQPVPVTQEAEMAIAESWAQKYEKIDGIFGGGDPIALAFMRGIQSANKTVGEDGTMIYGVDGAQDAYAAIKEGTMIGTAKQQPDELARIATEDVYTVIGGGKITHDWLTKVPVIYVDKNNVDEYME